LKLFDLDGPRITINPAETNYTISLGSIAFVLCMADGVPTPLVQWYTAGAPAISVAHPAQQFITVPTTLPQVTIYTCEAWNTVAGNETRKERSITVFIQGMYCLNISLRYVQVNILGISYGHMILCH